MLASPSNLPRSRLSPAEGEYVYLMRVRLKQITASAG
jgi:hypothetical protein